MKGASGVATCDFKSNKSVKPAPAPVPAPALNNEALAAAENQAPVPATLQKACAGNRSGYACAGGEINMLEPGRIFQQQPTFC